jgi:hypothetical protein
MAIGGVITNTGKLIALVNVYSAQASGTVSILRCGTGTDTPAVTDTGLEHATGSYYGVISGYPTFDTTNKRVTTRYFINSVSELNGVGITEFAEFYSGSTPNIFSHDVITPISKSGSDEIAIICTNSVV